ncbi:GNAT family N-acetyltransferase [Phnomibacter sp. MR]|uniref:GNAT family N-acetyltransferase n=1 Tax=Phnomibacter sp. MR TaxID=3042318 RepID=UPI003A7F6EAF
MQQNGIQFVQLHSRHLPQLLQYLQHLSEASQQRFAPHPFETDAIWQFYQPEQQHNGYIAIEATTEKIVGYFVIKRSFLLHDAPRLQAYGLLLHPITDFTLAPSVADAWQGKGLAGLMLQFVLEDICRQGAKRLFLWGGVQQTNIAAVRFYEKNGFSVLGKFDYKGLNTDMMLKLA